MAFEDASPTGLIIFVRIIERIKEDGFFPNREGEDDDDRENTQCNYIESW